ncbi:adenosylcobinamide-GDP ribazoletransferase [Methanolobus halotolerans]|uniref:Adenosylcobinamide-GDP ribazoletransferase n=1 Tax=Methanolobus halotolerans TaxID=2052935 RepID=A0A4E0QA02_9EURY|nr:adenosylcobinamide-GDP ribazoletransferase [Methanolobus halotolerans]TGC09132.1 adenosylcobinamide-GDP ribazoletransferase [Methanolobus halotolerans]
MNNFLLAVRSSFGFLSTIPVGITMEGLDEFFKRTYLHILVGIVLGMIMGAVAFVLGSFLSPQLSAVFIIIFVYYLTGLNHLDGIADLGDGMTAHGSREKKLKALKDMSLGIGGVAFAALTLLAFYAALVSLQAEALIAGGSVTDMAVIIFISIFVAEVSAMQSMLTIAAFGKSIHEGLGSILVDNTTLPKYFLGFALGIVSCTLAFWTIGIPLAGMIAFLAAIAATFILLNVSNRHFGGVNGDVIGSSNEIGRIIALIAIYLVIKYDIGGIVWTL